METKRLFYDSLDAIAHVGLAQFLASAYAEAPQLRWAFTHVKDAKEPVLIELSMAIDILKITALANALCARESEGHGISLAAGARVCK